MKKTSRVILTLLMLLACVFGTASTSYATQANGATVTSQSTTGSGGDADNTTDTDTEPAEQDDTETVDQTPSAAQQLADAEGITVEEAQEILDDAEASGDPDTATTDTTDDATDTTEETVEEQSKNILTPDGTGNVVDDVNVTYEDGELEFITINTRDGNTFYLIIDSTSGAVYFLNEVDNYDLSSIIDEEGLEAYEEAMASETSTEDANESLLSDGTDTETVDGQSADASASGESSSSGSYSFNWQGNLPMFICIPAVIVLIFFVIRRKRNGGPSDDDYDEENYDDVNQQ